MDPTPTSDPSKRIFRVAIVTILAFVALLVLWPKAQERLAPTPVRSHVAIRPAGSDVAIVGPVEIEPGQEFTLHAVLEAETRSGASVFYTEAPGLEIGGRRVDAEALLTWDRPQLPKVFWFTVEGPAPYVEVKALEHVDRVGFTEYFQPDWPLRWSVPGRLDTRYDQSLARGSGSGEALSGRRTFGTQRYQVRIELFDDEDDLTPAERLTSPGSDALPDGVAELPTVYAAFPGAAGPASLAFGLTQIEPVEGLDGGSEGALRRRLAELTDRRLAFSRVPLVGAVIEAAGHTPEELTWSKVDLAAGPAWSVGGAVAGGEAAGAAKARPSGVAQGDLLRAGGRVVVLFEDRGAPGVLDREDLCFDFEQGARVQPLSEVFEDEGGLLELALLDGGRDERE